MTRPGVVVLASVLVTFLMGQPVEGQGGGGSGGRRGSVSAAANAEVRAELAAVLLQTGRYDEAAREYRLLVVRDPGNVSYRLGLARALAWGKLPREAEQELRILSARRPNDAEIETLLRSVRASMEPHSREAAEWVAERPAYMPYRHALARALVREGKAEAALPHYDRLLLHDTSSVLRREGVRAYAAAGKLGRATSLLLRSLEQAPGDTAARHALARTLVNANQYEAARAQYDTLIALYPTRGVLMERARLNVTRGDVAGAEADAHAANAAGENADAHVLLGELHRRRGDFAGARLAYSRARMLEPEDGAISRAAGELAREARPIAGFMATANPAGSWLFSSAGSADNQDMSYVTAGARRDFRITPGVGGGVDVELRRMSGVADEENVDVGGIALSLDLAGGVAYGPLLVRLRGRGGISHQSGAAVFAGGIATAVWFRAWGLMFERSAGPAYPMLLAAAALRPSDDGEVLTERTMRAGAGGPLGRADVSWSALRTEISDGNRLSSLRATLRYPLSPRVAAVQSLAGMWFAERSPLYWDPIAYIAGAAGVEYAERRPRGLSFAARVLAGPARTVEEIERDGRTRETGRNALQLSGGVELGYRSLTKEVGAALTLGRGRTGEYQRAELSLFGRLLR